MKRQSWVLDLHHQGFCWCDQADSQIKMENGNFPRFCPCACVHVFVVRKNAGANQSVQRTEMWLPKLYTASIYLCGEAAVFLTSIRCCTIISELEFQAKKDAPQKWVKRDGTSLVAQWLRIHLSMQGSRVRALVREDPTCRGATKPVRYNYWACALEPVSHNYWARMPQLLKARVPRACAPQQREATAMRSPCTATKTQHSQK